MKENDIGKAKKIATDIVELVKHKNLKNIGESLEDFMVNNPKVNELTDRFSDKERATALEAIVKMRNKEDDIENLVAHLNTIKVTKRSKIRHYLLIGTVAAAMIVASFIIFNDTAHQNTSQQIVQNEKIDKPLLIMESGEKLIVEAENNKIVAADLIKIKTKDSVDVVTKNKLIIPSKSMFSIILDDGTEVTLNAQSELEYPSKFTGNGREVRVKGEAYFKVTKSDIPFVVKVGDGEVKVYGTSFNIKDRGSKGFETVLVSGSVGVKYQNSKEVMIKPNQRIVINAKDCTIEDIDTSQYTGWLTNAFQYFNTDARTIIEDIEKWYGIKIINTGDKIVNNEKISFNIDRDNAIQRIIELLEEALGIKIINEGGGLYKIK